jgi:glycosyltransferase involved in cell wall biosynthesis
MVMHVKIRAPKIRIPKIKPRKPEIVVGIPTYNEAETITFVTQTVDKGLQKYFPDKKSIIVNIDSNSSDRTKKIFLDTNTKTPKKCITTPKGKGESLRCLFEYFLGKESTRALMITDADAITIKPKWVSNLLVPIFKGFDHCFPLYNMHEYDVSVNNHFVYPVIRGVLGVDIREPIAGEMAFSRRSIDRLYNRDWTPAANKYGIDIFMALSSIFGEMRIAQAYLGIKEHKKHIRELPDIFEQTATSLFSLLDTHRYIWSRRVPVRKPPIFFKEDNSFGIPKGELDYKYFNDVALKEFKKYKKDISRIVDKNEFKRLEESFGRRAIRLETGDWVKVVFEFIQGSSIKSNKRAQALRPIYLARFLTFYKEFLDKDHKISERGIIDQAEQFYRDRKILLDLQTRK